MRILDLSGIVQGLDSWVVRNRKASKEPGQERITTQLSNYKTDQLQSGQSILELLLVLLILVPLLFGGIELARGVSLRHALSSGVLVAVRSLSLEPTTWSWSNTVINQSVSENVLGGGNASTPTIQAYGSTGTAISPTTLAGLPFGTPFCLEASVQYTPDITLLGGTPITIRVSHWGILERYP
jgi:Flp pilus assembly protein TadG